MLLKREFERAVSFESIIEKHFIKAVSVTTD